MNRFLISPLVYAFLLFSLWGVSIAIDHVSDLIVVGSFFGVNPVPESATVLLLGIGFIGLTIFGRRKSKLIIFKHRKQG
jgi:hypothetical protein